MVSPDKVVIDLPYDTCQTSIRQFCKEMILNYFPSTADMMKCYKGQRPLKIYFIISSIISPMSTKSIIGIGCEAIKNGGK